MKLNRECMLLYAVTDNSWLKEDETVIDQIKQTLDGGATLIQLREKDLSFDEFLKEAIQAKKVCEEYNVPLIINDNVEVAIECGADGVHVGQSDLEASLVREKIGEDKILGVSAQTLEQAKTAFLHGADYLGVGAVFTTTTKLDADSVPFDTLKSICDNINIPICAIGGIYKHNMSELNGSGIDGVALISAIFNNEDITVATKELYDLSKGLFYDK